MMSEDKSQVGQPIRILLVEDHALTRVGIKTVLKRESDLQVVGEAANGEEAVAQAEKLKPDVILMDVGMPIMDGIQSAKQIIDNGNSAKIIMLTQHDNDQDILASFSAHPAIASKTSKSRDFSWRSEQCMPVTHGSIRQLQAKC
jgi:DNA-binding NarL/FixJ family response regulator